MSLNRRKKSPAAAEITATAVEPPRQQVARQIVARVILRSQGKPDLMAVFERIQERLTDGPKLVLAKESAPGTLRFYAQQVFNFGEIRLVDAPVPQAALGASAAVQDYWKDHHAALLGHRRHIEIRYDLVQPFADHMTLGQMIGAAVERTDALAVNWAASMKTIEASEYLAFCNSAKGFDGVGQMLWWGMSAVKVKGTAGEDGVLISTTGLADLGLHDIECAAPLGEYQSSATFVQGVAVHMVHGRKDVPDGHVEALPFASGATRNVAFRHVPSVLDKTTQVIRVVW